MLLSPKRYFLVQYNPVYSSPEGPKKSDEYAGVTNKPNADLICLNGRVISRGLKNATNMPGRL